LTTLLLLIVSFTPNSIFTIITFIAISPIKIYAQPNLGTAIGFSLFTTSGAVGNTTFSIVSGNIGTNFGAVRGFIPPATFYWKYRNCQ
jgi:hypothetical protein